ncbi:hypothetical protein DRE_04208 [Drechslerella stenobrocha 248]|uniref:LysM domain-containing protein n=1 Tax=Drechslerella stenobrocha 248 TaxID=1043628 RepID=W7IBR0_9PEZI|nr:hypothetical protein DRE_04208 [Drechslerella stenobrocha 248]
MYSLLSVLPVIGLINSCHGYAPLKFLQARQTATSVAPAAAATASAIAGCSSWITVFAGDTCDGLTVVGGVTYEQLLEWNPSLKVPGACDSLVPDTKYCVGAPEKPTPTTAPTSKPPPPKPTTTQPVGNGIATPTPIQNGMTKSCNKFHMVTAGQNCPAIISKFPGTTIDLLAQWNPAIGKQCTGLWADTYICVSIIGWKPSPVQPPPSNGTPSPIGANTTKDCKKWTLVKAGESCQAIIARNGALKLSVADLFRWNPSIKADCTAMLAGHYICITGPGAPSPTVSTPPSNGTPSPIGANTTKDCKKWTLVKAGETCQAIIARNGALKLSVADLFRWNPSIKADCTAMLAGHYICITGPGAPSPTVSTPPSNGTPSPIGANTTKDCKKWTLVKAGETCQAIIARNGALKLSVADLFRWNPSIKADCTAMLAGHYICITGPAGPKPPAGEPTPSPVQPGTVKNCKTWAYVKDGQTCKDVLARFPKINLAKLVAWNPAIGKDCTKLWARSYVCVAA